MPTAFLLQGILNGVALGTWNAKIVNEKKCDRQARVFLEICDPATQQHNILYIPRLDLAIGSVLNLDAIISTH
jgi:hypothetical protein